jgi:hypothetical protein
MTKRSTSLRQAAGTQGQQVSIFTLVQPVLGLSGEGGAGSWAQPRATGEGGNTSLALHTAHKQIQHQTGQGVPKTVAQQGRVLQLESRAVVSNDGDGSFHFCWFYLSVFNAHFHTGCQRAMEHKMRVLYVLARQKDGGSACFRNLDFFLCKTAAGSLIGASTVQDFAKKTTKSSQVK